MTPLRLTRRPAPGRRIGAAGLARARATIAPATPDIDSIADRIAPLPPPAGIGGAIADPGRS